MDTKPPHPDAPDDPEQAVAAWMTTEALTGFMTATFAAAVQCAEDDPALTRDRANMRALRHVAGKTHRLMVSRQGFVSETVGANASDRRYVQAAQASAYLVRVVFVALRTAEQSVARGRCRCAWPGVRSQRRTSCSACRRCTPPWSGSRVHADRLDAYAYADDGIAPKLISCVRARQIKQLDRVVVPEVTRTLEGLPRVSKPDGPGRSGGSAIAPSAPRMLGIDD